MPEEEFVPVTFADRVTNVTLTVSSIGNEDCPLLTFAIEDNFVALDREMALVLLQALGAAFGEL